MNRDRIIEKIKHSSPLELTIINFHCLLEYVHQSKLACEEDNSAKMCAYIAKAQNFIYLLISSLDMDYELSRELLQIYLHSDSLLMMAYSRRDYHLICEACDMLGSILDAFRMIPPEKTIEKAKA